MAMRLVQDSNEKEFRDSGIRGKIVEYPRFFYEIINTTIIKVETKKLWK